jgi:hypothetical protein
LGRLSQVLKTNNTVPCKQQSFGNTKTHSKGVFKQSYKNPTNSVYI